MEQNTDTQILERIDERTETLGTDVKQANSRLEAMESWKASEEARVAKSRSAKSMQETFGTGVFARNTLSQVEGLINMVKNDNTGMLSNTKMGLVNDGHGAVKTTNDQAKQLMELYAEKRGFKSVEEAMGTKAISTTNVADLQANTLNEVPLNTASRDDDVYNRFVQQPGLVADGDRLVLTPNAIEHLPTAEGANYPEESTVEGVVVADNASFTIRTIITPEALRNNALPMLLRKIDAMQRGVRKTRNTMALIADPADTGNINFNGYNRSTGTGTATNYDAYDAGNRFNSIFLRGVSDWTIC